MEQKLNQRVISENGGQEGTIVNLYDNDFNGIIVHFVVVRWDEDPEFGVDTGFDDPHCEPIDSAWFRPSRDKNHDWVVVEDSN